MSKTKLRKNSYFSFTTGLNQLYESNRKTILGYYLNSVLHYYFEIF